MVTISISGLTQRKTRHRSPGRGLVAVVTALSLIAGMVTAPQTAMADGAAPTVTRDPAVDRANLVRLWQQGGAFVRAAAGQALLGGDTEVEAFVANGWQEPQRLDDRAAAEHLMAQGGTYVRAAAKTALASSDPTAVRSFLASGWQAPRTADLRLRINQMMATARPYLKDAAQAALDSYDSDTYEAFLDSGWKKPWAADLRTRVNQVMSAGGPNVKDAAQVALDSNNVDVYAEFLGSGWALATARDQEQATIADLTGSAVAASEEAVRQANATDEAAARAAAAAEAAKQAAARAAQLAASAHGNAQLAATAAMQAADAANQAANAASEAISAANAATAAARSAAAAASRAAAAASRAADAATDAYNAAAAAETKAGTAKDAKDAAIAARNTAQDAKATAKAASDAATAANNAAKNAVDAANGAAQDAGKAAAAADAAATASGEASAEAKQAHIAAARAQANATRAKQAATASANFAHTAAAAAQTAAAAADRAVADAIGAADAADAAAVAAEQGRFEAGEATKHANAASAAAASAVAADKAAHDVYDAARQADIDRITAAGNQADEAAVAAKNVFAQVSEQTAADAEESAARDAETNRLIAEATAAGTPAATVLADARKIALVLAENAGAWVRSAALRALGGSDAVALDFVRTQLPWATGQDNRVKLAALADPEMSTNTDRYKAAAATALAGSDADVAAFLASGDYPGRAKDLRLKVNQAMAEARTAGYGYVMDAAQAALDDGSVAALQAFLTIKQDSSRAADERLKVHQVMAGSAQNSKTQALAQAALDGPVGLLHQFLTIGQYQSAQADQQAAEHDAAMQAMLAHADQAANLATKRANEAQQAAANARADADAAGRYEQAARDSANAAAADGERAKASAAAAKASADQAAASAAKAADAAKRAEAAAHDAARSAAWADQSARQAAASAADAQASAKRAYDAATAAHNDAETAVKAANDAVAAAKTKAEQEVEAAKTQAREQCKAYLKDGVPNGKDSYQKCLDMVAMSSEDRANLVAKNTASCQTLFPNHASKEFNNCVKDVSDPAFDTNQSLVVKQIKDAENDKKNRWWKIGLGVLVGAAVVACVIIEPCGAFVASWAVVAIDAVVSALPAGLVAFGGAAMPWLALAGELSTPFVAGGAFVGVTAAVGGTEFLLAGSAAMESGVEAVEISTESSVEIAGVLQEVDEIATEARSIENLGEQARELCLTNSFAAETLVVMADGSTKPMNSVGVGDLVLATDPITGATGPQGVVQTHRNQDSDLADLVIGTGDGHAFTVHTTAHHPFYDTTRQGWVEAAMLPVGDQLYTGADAGRAAVQSIKTWTGLDWMYNLSLANVHTYYVLAGKTPLLVHNCDVVGIRNAPMNYNPTTTGQIKQQMAYDYQRAFTGLFEYQVRGGGAEVWADGIDGEMLVDAKFVLNPKSSPYTGTAPDFVSKDTIDEFERYGKVIGDPATGFKGLRVVTNCQEAVDYFTGLMTRLNIPGEVLLRP